MRKFMLLAGAAALAAAMPAIAKNEDRGKGRGGGPAAHAQHQGGGQGRAERGKGRGGGQEARSERRGNGNADRGRGRGRSDEARGERGNRGDERRADRDQRREERRLVREERRGERGRDRGGERRLARGDRLDDGDRRGWRDWAERRVRVEDRFDEDFDRWRESRGRRLAVGREGCPPGLARQNAFCMPPGQLRKAQLIGQRLSVDRLGMVPERYLYRFDDDERFLYRYAPDGTVYRIDRASGLVSGVIPLFADGLFVGEPMPLGYEVYNVPLAYRPMFADSDDYLYRYDDSAIFRVNRESMLIEGIVALLTGGVGGLGGLGVGDALPLGYDAYNVPLGYRDTYFDTPDAMYRYADGYVYQVDPETRLIEAVISLLT